MPSFPSAFSSRRWQTLCAALLIAMLPLPTLADWRYVASDYSGEPLGERLIQFAADGSRWSFGVGVRRTDAQGNTRLVRRSYPGGQLAAEMITGGIVLDDGGALLLAESSSAPSCTVQRIDAQLRPTWRTQQGLPGYSCVPPFANSAGLAWLHESSALRALGADGSLGATAQASSSESDYFGSSGFVLANGSIVVGSSRVDSRNTAIAAHLNRFARDGSLVWSWQHASRTRIEHLLPLGNDTIGALDDFGTDGTPAVLRWNSSGNLVWSLPQPAGVRTVLGLVAAAANDVYVLGSTALVDSDLTIQRLSADGQVRWRRDVGCSKYFQPFSVTLDGNDGLALICSVEGTRRTQLLRLDRNGSAAAVLPLPLHDASHLVRQPDGRLRVAGSDADVPSRGVSLIIDGNAIARAPDGPPLSADLYLSASRIAADGSSYLALEPSLSADDPRQQILLRKLDAQGNLVWSHALQNAHAMDDVAGLAHNAGRVCALLWQPVAASMQASAICLDADNGSELWRTAIPDSPYLKGKALRVLDDGRLVAVVSIGGEHEVRRFAADGQLLPATRHAEEAFHAVIDAHGRATVITPSIVSQYAPDGSLTYRIEGAALPLQFGDYLELPPPASFAGDDGSVWLTGPPRDWTRQQNVAWAIAPDGSTRWLRNIGTQRRGTMIASGDALYIARWETPGGGDGGSPVLEANYLTRLDKASGTQQWEYISYDPIQLGADVASATHTDGSPAIALSADGQQLLMLHSWRNRLRLQRIDTARGQQQHERYLECTPFCAPPRELAADAAGTLRASVGIFDNVLGNTATVLALDHAAGPMPRIRLDQAGIGGAWWSPYANGEGIAFDWLPASRTVFAAWFTYANTGGNDTAGLRWYTLQVNGVANGATTLELPILKTSGGNFAAGPSVSPQRVGTARLELHDCNNGTLYYAFDPGQNDGRSGSITLSRLSPPTQACILADGSSQPASGARPPQQGFDAGMSGSWYEETNPGQGVQFTVQPGGVFFAPWFTFDRGRGNDDGRQHWFTLQGNLATARDGEAYLQLIQTTGGLFDRVPTYNAYVVGGATLRMQGCDRAQLDYRFNVDASPGPFQAHTGTLNLVKAGGCTTP